MKVSHALKLLYQDGWRLVRSRGSHRQFKHPVKSGRVTVPGKPSDDLAPGTLRSILKQLDFGSEVRVVRYAVVIEDAGSNYSAYVPDLPGCVATGRTVAETEVAIREAIEFHLEGLREDGSPVPPPTSRVNYVDVTS